MKRPQLWKFMITTFTAMIKHSPNTHVSNVFIDLIKIFINYTIFMWKYEHINYIEEINMFEELCIFFKKRCIGYERRCSLQRHYNKMILQMISEMTKSFYMLSKDVLMDNEKTFKDYYIIKCINITTKHWKNKKKPLSLMSRKFEKYKANIDDFIKSNPSKFKELQFINEYKKNKQIICRNVKCKKNKSQNTSTKFKLCSKCKIVYYCSKACQKRDWNNYHRMYCHLMALIYLIYV